MADEEKKIIVDDDWKAEAAREKERLAQEGQGKGGEGNIPDPSFAELVNILVMQAMAALGLLTGPGGERMQPDTGAAKHFIDMLQLLEDKTKGNLTKEEQQLLDQTLYEARMAFVQVSQGGGMPSAGGPPTQGG